MEWPRRCCLNPRIWSPSTSLRGVQLNKTNPNSVDNIKVAVSHCCRHLISFTCVYQMRRWPHRLRVAKNFPFSENSRDQISSPETPGPSVLSSTIGSSSLLSKSQMETVRPNPLYKQIISQRSIFREWTEYLQGNPGRSVLFSSTQSEATSSARRIRLFQNEQRMLFPAFINLKISSS